MSFHADCTIKAGTSASCFSLFRTCSIPECLLLLYWNPSFLCTPWTAARMEQIWAYRSNTTGKSSLSVPYDNWALFTPPSITLSCNNSCMDGAPFSSATSTKASLCWVPPSWWASKRWLIRSKYHIMIAPPSK